MTSIIYPMAALVFLTVAVILIMLFLRVKAVRSRKISPRYFKINKGGELPEQLTAITQNFNNLLELPILFYVVCTLALVLNKEASYFITAAWLYVILRYAHSIIHTMYNHIIHRLYAFAASCVVLVAMWVKVVVLVSAVA